MTEDEAKKKWCPFARTLDWASDVVRSGDEPTIVGAAVNRVAGNYDREGNETVEISGRHRCIGSACMAWRMTSEALGPRRVHPNVLADGWHGWTVTDAEPDEKGYVGISPPTQTDHGHCGLAGAPA